MIFKLKLGQNLVDSKFVPYSKPRKKFFAISCVRLPTPGGASSTFMTSQTDAAMFTDRSRRLRTATAHIASYMQGLLNLPSPPAGINKMGIARALNMGIATTRER